MPVVERADHAAAADWDRLRSVIELFDSHGVDYWLAGGWAVDFHLGKITRRHTDVDLVVHHADKHRLHNLALSEGYRVADDSDPEAEINYARGELKLDLSFVKRQGDQIVSPGWESWPWPEDSFTTEPVEFQGLSVRLIAASTLLTGKRDYEAMVGEPPRPHDLADIKALEGLLGQVVRHAGAVLRSDDKVLLCHRTESRLNYPNVWDLPGGRIERDERPEEAITRELEEEVGISVREPDGPYAVLRMPGIELSVFLIEEWAGVPVNAAPDEHDKLCWFGKRELESLTLAHPSYHDFLGGLLDTKST